MPEMLLINPRPRRKSRKAPSAAQRRARAAFAAMARARAGSAKRRRRPARRRRNPIPPGATPVLHAAPARRRAARRRNPAPMLARHRRSRRRNPISLGSTSAYVSMIKQGLIGGAGALAVDVAMGYISPYLPATLQRTPGQVGVGDAVKAVITIALGKVLDRPTKGLSMQAARGALVVQSHALLAQMLPSTMTLGYAVPARVANVSNRIGPNSLRRYTAPGATPLLNRYITPGATPLLSGRDSTMARESRVR